MAKTWRLILDDKLNGYHNMAVDEAIFANYSKKRTPTLRIYGWSPPFISLGCNQKINDVLKDSCPYPFVRRMTGGSAILHDQELTYSLTCSSADLDLPHRLKDSYRKLCSFLFLFYSKLGLKADFAEDLPGYCEQDYGSFCFSSYQGFDLIIKGKKIGGNAQRRKKDIIFQHGSIPQKIDFKIIEKVIKGVAKLSRRTASLKELLGKGQDFSRLGVLLVESFKQTFGVEFKER